MPAPVARALHHAAAGDPSMTDLVIVLLTLALYAAALGFVRLCERVGA